MTATWQQATVDVAQGERTPIGWVRGCPDDVVLFTALVNGTGAMPDDMVQLVPKLRKNMAGPKPKQQYGPKTDKTFLGRKQQNET